MDPFHFDYSHSDTGANRTSQPAYHHNDILDTTLGSTLLALSLLGTLFNLTVVLAVRAVTKRNCSKARLASSLLIFNLSLSDTLYSTVHLFSAITMLTGGRDPAGVGIPGNLPSKVLCNLTGVFFNLTMRTSLWFLTLLTLVRYVSVMFPLKVQLLITKQRVTTLAVGVWLATSIMPLVPFILRDSYQYNQQLSICIWHVAWEHSYQTQVAVHVILMVIPIVLPGILIIALYLQIVWKVIQLKTVHYKLRSGRIDKEEKEEIDEDKDLVEKDPLPINIPPVSSTSKRKKISMAFNSWSSSLSFLNRPLSIVDLERIEKETESIDQDLMNYAVSSLSRSAFSNQSTDRAGVVAYYINRFIVKTAGSGTFERIQSHSFTDSRRSLDYDAEECPISLNYYDCKDITSSTWSLRRGSEPVCTDPENNSNHGSSEKVNLSNIKLEQRNNGVTSPDMATVVAQAMKKFLNKDLEDIKKMGNNPPGVPSKKKSVVVDPNKQPVRRLSSLREVAARCRSNSILEETTATTTPSQLSPKMICVGGVCRQAPVSSSSSMISNRFTENPSSSFRLNTSIKEHVELETYPKKVPAEKRPFSKTFSLPDKLVPAEIEPPCTLLDHKKRDLTQSLPAAVNPPPKSKPSLKKKIMYHLRESRGNHKKREILQEKRINRLDMRLRVIIQSAFYTLLMVTLFVICYMPWWILSIDILCRLTGKNPLLNISFTWYCNFLTISYTTILFSACSNPVIYFYFAYKQAMLDTLKLKYKRLTKRNYLKGKFVLKVKNRKRKNSNSGNTPFHVNADKAKSKL